ncbi:MAG: SDR family oxidoreductase [Bdellovibrionales bacterium]|nr:SDR family oxidoreductase [Bdellovibrionales bacterium]
MYKKLAGKKVLITGAATGIGKVTALAMAKEGCDIAINFFSSDEQAKKLAQEICNEVHGHDCRTLLLQGNVGEEKDVLHIFDQIKSQWGHLDILINNAGIQKKCPSHELDLESFQNVLNTNAVGTFLCSREAIKMFLSNNIKGVILNNTSVHQLIPKPQYLSYSMSKGAVNNLTKTLALEYAKYGIRVNNIAPGAIITPINPWASNESKKSQIREHIPLEEIGNAEQVASAMVFLASDDSNYVTGQTLFVDGGLTLYPDFGEDWASS